MPFLVSIALVVVGIIIRRVMPETPEFEETGPIAAKEGRPPLLSALREEWRSIVIVFVATAGQIGLGYLYLVFILYYVQSVLQMDASIGLLANMCAAIVSLAVTPVFGWLGDRFGAKRVYLLGLAFSAVIVLAVFPLLETREVVPVLLAVGLGSGIGVASLLAVQGSYFAEKFPAKNRTSGFVLGRETATAIVGGLTPLVATALVLSGGTPAVAVLAAALAVVPLVVLLVMDRGASRSGT